MSAFTMHSELSLKAHEKCPTATAFSMQILKITVHQTTRCMWEMQASQS